MWHVGWRYRIEFRFQRNLPLSESIAESLPLIQRQIAHTSPLRQITAFVRQRFQFYVQPFPLGLVFIFRHHFGQLRVVERGEQPLSHVRLSGFSKNANT